jgi:hypothetical protein
MKKPFLKAALARSLQSLELAEHAEKDKMIVFAFPL